MSTLSSTVRFGSRWSAIAFVLSLGFVAGACSEGSRNMTGPSAIGGSQVGPSAQAADDDTAIAYLNPVGLSVTIQTTTTSTDPVDNGTIKLFILVDAAGNAVPCDTANGIWVRFDGEGNGLTVTGGQTTHTEDFGNIGSRNLAVEGSGETVKNVSCGQPFCIRALYTTRSGAPPKAGTHHSDTDYNPLDAPYTFACATQACSPGFWKQDFHFDEWPESPLPTDSFFSVFARTITVGQQGQLPDVTDPTLAEAAAATGGGDSRTARIGTAAYLSAVHPDVAYPYTPAEIITAVQNAIDGIVGPISIDDLENVWKLNPDHCPLGDDPGDPS